MKFKTLFILFLYLLIYSVSYSQEICDNGIDDDGNGLIDLQDSTCYCNLFNYDSVSSIIPNHSFEDTLCCPNTHSQMNCVSDWQKASQPTTDYFNLCGLTSYWGALLPPMPIVDGDGYCGLFVKETPSGNTKEYVGTCLSDTMFAGTQYKLKLHIAYGFGNDSCVIQIFGTNNCSDMPFPTTPSVSCPLIGSGNWVSLGLKEIVLDTTKWNELEISFTPSQNITTLVIGPACSYFTGNHYIYIDNILLNKETEFRPKTKEHTEHCNKEITLFTDIDSPPNSFQWYKDSIAIVGETNSHYTVPPNSPGLYQVRLLYDSGCLIQLFKVNVLGEYELEMPNVFSPNKDNVNDIFKPIKFECISEATLYIFNRWGQIVYETSDIPFIWDGKTNDKDCSSGVYFWTISLTGKEGEIKEKGNVTLFR